MDRKHETTRITLPVSSLGRFFLPHNDDNACPMPTIKQFYAKVFTHAKCEFQIDAKPKTFSPLTLSGIPIAFSSLCQLGLKHFAKVNNLSESR